MSALVEETLALIVQRQQEDLDMMRKHPIRYLCTESGEVIEDVVKERDELRAQANKAKPGELWIATRLDENVEEILLPPGRWRIRCPVNFPIHKHHVFERVRD